MRNLRILIVYGLVLTVSATVDFGQKMNLEKPIVCKSKLAVRGKFETLFVGSSGGASFQVKIKIDVEHQTDENYLAIANQLKAKYCKQEKMYVSMFDSNEHKRLGSIPQPDRPIEGYPRALYVLDRLTGRELIEVYKIVNGRIETRVLEISQ